jgi:hypothetical protein
MVWASKTKPAVKELEKKIRISRLRPRNNHASSGRYCFAVGVFLFTFVASEPRCTSPNADHNCGGNGNSKQGHRSRIIAKKAKSAIDKAVQSVNILQIAKCDTQSVEVQLLLGAGEPGEV